MQTAFAALVERKVTPNNEYEEIEDISEKYRKRDLSDEWMELCNYALNTGRVAFNNFELYAAE